MRHRLARAAACFGCMAAAHSMMSEPARGQGVNLNFEQTAAYIMERLGPISTSPSNGHYHRHAYEFYAPNRLIVTETMHSMELKGAECAKTRYVIPLDKMSPSRVEGSNRLGVRVVATDAKSVIESVYTNYLLYANPRRFEPEAPSKPRYQASYYLERLRYDSAGKDISQSMERAMRHLITLAGGKDDTPDPFGAAN